MAVSLFVVPPLRFLIVLALIVLFQAPRRLTFTVTQDGRESQENSMRIV